LYQTETSEAQQKSMTRAERRAPINHPSARKINVVGFDAARFRAPFTLRCGALLIDYLLMIAAPVLTFLVVSARGLGGAKFWRDETLTFGWLIALLIAITNLIILPVVAGRSAGKFLTGLRVVQRDGSNPTFLSAILRHIVGYPLTLATGGLGFMLAVFNQKGRALHDFLAGTIVVQARRKRVVVVNGNRKVENAN
jgi:uncharacterized RDD family membrane protein YckC